MRNVLRKMNLSSKLVLLVYVCFICIYIILNIFWFAILEWQARQEFSSNSYRMCALGNQMIDKECSYLQGIAAYLSVSSKTQEMLRANKLGQSTPDLGRLASELENLKYPVSLVFFDLEGMPIDSMSIDDSEFPIRQLPDEDTPFAHVLKGTSSYEWEFIDQGSPRLFERDNSPKLCLWHMITDSKTTQPLGVIAIAVDSRRIISMGPTQDSPYFQLILLDQKSGRVAFNHSAYSNLDAATREHLISLSAAHTSGDTIINYEGRRYYLYFTRSGVTPLSTFYMQPYSTFLQDFPTFWFYFLAVLTFLTLALFPMLRYAFRKLTMPLRRLTATVDGFAQGDLQASFQYDGEDEIGKLARVFNEMVQTNQEMLKKTLELRMREREAELNALQAQINPHFLYNMLNMIYWRALRSGNDELADISYAMGCLFRMTLKRSHTMITLREEFEICSYYLMLQKKRFGDHIEYSLSSEPDLEEAVVPKLLLQPLVENAIVHGAENYTGVVHIRLSACRSGDQITFQVINDGSVIPEEVLRALPDCSKVTASPRSGNRFALRNIDDRLKLLFNDSYRFTFESSEESGTIVTISYPLSFSAMDIKEDSDNA